MAKKEPKSQQAQLIQATLEPVAVAVPVAPVKVHFDAWWAVMHKKLPLHHHKEVIKADFKARGLSMHETMTVFTDALGQYGIKL
jgi:hypothetical protein